MEKESLEDVYKRFRLEKIAVDIKTGEDCFGYVGELNSVIWKIPEECREYIELLANNMDEITKDFDTEPKIKSTYHFKQGFVTTKRNNGEIVKCNILIYNPNKRDIMMRLDNGFLVSLYQDNTFEVIDIRKHLLNPSESIMMKLLTRHQITTMDTKSVNP